MGFFPDSYLTEINVLFSELRSNISFEFIPTLKRLNKDCLVIVLRPLPIVTFVTIVCNQILPCKFCILFL